MSVLKYMLGNLRKRKSYSVVIFSLVFLAGLILTVTLSAVNSTFNAFNSAFEAARGPHLLYWMSADSYDDNYAQWFSKQDSVESVRIRKDITCPNATLTLNGSTLRNNTVLYLMAYDPADRMRLSDTNKTDETLLSTGEIYLPHIYKTANGVVTGDTVEYRFGTQAKAFTVAGFVEEPLLGAELHGAKLLFISSDDIETLRQNSAGVLQGSIQIRARLKVYSEQDAYALAREFTSTMGVTTGNVYTYGALQSGHLTLPTISLVVLLAFVLILCIITIIIIRYAILATVEADCTNIGIIKALGFTPWMVQLAVTGQYALLAVCASSLSLTIAAMTTPIVSRIILASSGLMYNGYLDVPGALITLIGLIALISLFSLITAGATRLISPVRAIAQGAAPVYFSSRMNIRLEKLGFLPFNLRMAIKQILTKSKRYVMLLVISTLLCYALVFLLGLVQMFQSDRALNALGGELSDVRINASSFETARAIAQKVDEDYGAAWITYQNTTQLTVDGDKTVITVKDSFDSTGELSTLSGRHPRHENELAVSSLLSSRLDKSLGDTLLVQGEDGTEHPFLITGIYQTIDNGGISVRMLDTGMRTIYPEYELKTAFVKLKSHESLDQAVADMNMRYTGFDEILNERAFTKSKLDTIQSVFSAITALVFALTLCVVGFVTMLIAKITVYSEARELGIYKAMGFSAARMRLQLALRFLMVTSVGSLCGATLAYFLGARLFGLLLRGFGLSSFMIDISAATLLLPIAAMAMISVLSAYLSSRNIKKVSAYNLITE